MNIQLALEVKKITWTKHNNIWYHEIELHMTSWMKKYDDDGNYVGWSIKDFYEWYAPLVGKSISWFI